METLVTLLRSVHIGAGLTALLAGPAAMVAPHLGNWHRRWGKTYLWAMGVIALTAEVLSYVHRNVLVMLAAVFSFYVAFSGYRTILRTRLSRSRYPSAVDWLASAVMLAAALASALVALRGNGMDEDKRAAMLLFAVFGAAMACRDIAWFVRPPTDGEIGGAFAHAGSMLSAYTATFFGLYVGLLPTVWLWPVVIVAPRFFVWISYRAYQFTASPLKSNA